MNLRRTVPVLLVAILAVSVRPALAQMEGYYPKGGPDIEAQEVSLVQLIATPERYDGKTVRLIGYLHLEFEGDAIYLHRDDFMIGISNNAVWIDLPKDIKPAEIKTVNDHYVICTAQFVASNHGHMGMFSGALTNVTRLEIWPVAGDSKREPPPPPKPLK
jgi:hypothetical protein